MQAEKCGEQNQFLADHDTGCDGRRWLRMQILKAGALYFNLVFGAGFILGVVASNDETIIVTVHDYDPEVYEPDYRTRRKRQ
jgi:hypothetical protein